MHIMLLNFIFISMGLYTIMNDWSDDIEKILNDIRINSNNLSNYHKN